MWSDERKRSRGERYEFFLVSQINDYFEQHPYQEVFILAIVGSILGITIEYLVNGNFLIENIWTFLFLNLGFLYQAYRKQKRTKEKKK
ncbi:hypothetical protein U1294_03840 [Enterococcus cecorum]|uniref:Uncharacterized protein n=1 Tax=Enterococcus cecorum TaxID=44008 RepID=A0AAW9JVA7_9ENTE|nr:hypothetical protein [Enterococcus cecorum]MDZ5550011.1 hypothetical protein [Enterococcus cecorum]MDZ5597361.1 hypothetical protein [Enterococcus cecorum]